MRGTGGDLRRRSAPAAAEPPAPGAAGGLRTIHVDGGASQTDSNAIDAAGNIYQGVHGIPRILVYGPGGELRTTVDVATEDEGLESATNIAIEPGTTDAYVTVSGPAGGYVHRFDALGEGIRASNGG